MKKITQLSADAEKYNTPPHFGKQLEHSLSDDDSEILPINKSKYRRPAKAKRKI